MKLAKMHDVSLYCMSDAKNEKKYSSAMILQKLAGTLGVKPCLLLVDEDDLEVYDKHELLKLYKERLLKKIFDDFNDIKKKREDKDKVDSDKD